MEFDEHDGEGEVTLPPPPPVSIYESSERSRAKMMTPSAGESIGSRKARYRECLKNHAVSIGGHAVDGCGEFMPGGEEGTFDALKCVACNCHRNFHRRESDDHHFHQFSLPCYLPSATPGSGYLHIGGGGGGGSKLGPHPLSSQPFQNHHYPQPQALALPHQEDREMEEMADHHGDIGSGREGDGDGTAAKKRSRTKFTQEQKERMLEFAKKLGWRIQKHDEEAVQEFCREMSVERHVLKVWMHNNKHTLGKKPEPTEMQREEEITKFT